MPKGVTPLSFLVIVHRKGAKSAKKVETGFKPVATKNINKNHVLPSVQREPRFAGQRHIPVFTRTRMSCYMLRLAPVWMFFLASFASLR